MYDTISMFLEGYTPQVNELFYSCPQESIVVTDKKHYNRDRGYTKAYLPYPNHQKTGQGWTIYRFESGVKIEGSPTKWYFGQNADTLSLSQSIESFESLGDTLNIPHYELGKANIKRLDFSSVVTTTYPPKVYYPLLTYLYGYRRDNQYNNSLYFHKTEKTIVFYDKKEEAKTKGMVLPEWSADKNLLRYEVKYTNPRRTHLMNYASNLDGEGNIYLYDLLNERMYEECVDTWLSLYGKINKTKNDNAMQRGLTRPKKVIEAVMGSLTNRLGLDIVNELVQTAFEYNPKLNTKQRRIVREKFKSLYESVPKEFPDFITELNERVKTKADYLKRHMLKT